jgi:hypothetical protein
MPRSCTRQHLLPTSPSASTADLPPAILRLRIVLVVLSQPDVLDQACVSGYFADEYNSVPDDGLGAPLPRHGQDGSDDCPQQQAPDQPRPKHHDSVHPQHHLQRGKKYGDEGEDEDDIWAVGQHRPDAHEHRLQNGVQQRDGAVEERVERPQYRLEGRLAAQDVVGEELEGLLGEDAYRETRRVS